MFEQRAERRLTAVPAGSGGLATPGRLAMGCFVLYVAAVFAMQALTLADADNFHEEIRPLFRYHRVADPALFAGDYLAAYAEAFAQPRLYDALTRLWLRAGGDLLLLHRLIPLACWLAFIAGMALAARRLGGAATMAAVVGLAVAQPIYLFQTTSALPHAFAFPLLAWGLTAALAGSLAGLAAMVILAGLLYPAVAPLLGLVLAWLAFLGRRAHRPAGRLATVLLVGITGLVSLWLLYDSLVPPQHLGPALPPLHDVERVPENGPQGRHFGGVLDPVSYVVGKVGLQFRSGLGTAWLGLLAIYGLLALYGFTGFLRRGAAGNAVVAFVACAAAIFLAVLLLRPYFAYRFLLYPAMTVMPLLFVLGVRQAVTRFGGGARAAALAAVASTAVIVVASDSLNAQKLGYLIRLDDDSRRVMAFAGAQPRQTLFAVWPGTDSGLELIPYLAGRPLFVMEKLHYPSFEDHRLTMRTRAYALIEAYLAAGEAAPLRALRCRWGVDYLVVEKAHFSAQGPRPEYFAPFADRIAAIWQDRAPADFLLHAPPADWVALETGRHAVIDLQALAPVCAAAPAPDSGAGQWRRTVAPVPPAAGRSSRFDAAAAFR